MSDKAVSAVIGVILMVAITVAIAATVYVYISDIVERGYTTDIVFCGHIDRMPQQDITDYIVLDQHIYIMYRGGISQENFQVMDFAYEHGCAISFVLINSISGDNTYGVRGDSVSLIDCGCD